MGNGILRVLDLAYTNVGNNGTYDLPSISSAMKELHLEGAGMKGTIPANWAYALECMSVAHNPHICGALPSGGLPCFDSSGTAIGKVLSGN
jgi:hypothetical protein